MDPIRETTIQRAYTDGAYLERFVKASTRVYGWCISLAIVNASTQIQMVHTCLERFVGLIMRGTPNPSLRSVPRPSISTRCYPQDFLLPLSRPSFSSKPSPQLSALSPSVRPFPNILPRLLVLIRKPLPLFLAPCSQLLLVLS